MVFPYAKGANIHLNEFFGYWLITLKAVGNYTYQQSIIDICNTQIRVLTHKNFP